MLVIRLFPHARSLVVVYQDYMGQCMCMIMLVFSINFSQGNLATSFRRGGKFSNRVIAIFFCRVCQWNISW